MKTNYESVGTLPEQSLEKNFSKVLMGVSLGRQSGAFDGEVPKVEIPTEPIPEKPKNYFDQVRGELQEGIDYLQNPDEYTTNHGIDVARNTFGLLENGKKDRGSTDLRELALNGPDNLNTRNPLFKDYIVKREELMKERNPVVYENNKGGRFFSDGQELISPEPTRTQLNIKKGERKGPIVTDLKEPLKEHPSTIKTETDPFFGYEGEQNELRTRQQDIANGKINPGKPENTNGTSDGTNGGTEQTDIGNDEKPEQSENNPT